MITVYTKKNCFPCAMTKRKLQELGATYHEINIDDDLGALNYLIECGLRSLPVVFLDDKPIITGGYAPNILETIIS